MSQIIDSTPKQDGYFMPAEYEPHAGCWIIWPERTDNWRLGAKPAQATFVEVATAISQFESVTVAVSDRQFGNARSMLPPEIRLVELSTNDSWARDCGPTFVKKGNDLRAVDWQFNAWGGLDSGLYFPWDLDAKVAQKIAEIERIDLYKAPFVLEGGSIHVDGEGTLLTTEECLLNPNRNPNLSKTEIETLLKAYLNVSKIIWLRNGVYNDETNGHVDNVCCFIRPGVVALTWTDDKNDPQYALSLNAFERLSAATDAQGRAFEIHKIHQPGPIYITKEESEGVDSIEGTLPRQEGDRLAGSYINFYIANCGIVLPIFNDHHDQQAIDQIQTLFPDRKVVPVLARDILLGGGNIHCITQQQPATSL